MYLFNTPKELIETLAMRIEEERILQKLSQKDLLLKQIYHCLPIKRFCIIRSYL